MFARLLLLALPALLAGCGRPLVLDDSLPAQIAEIGCIGQCQSAREACDADARYDFQQCQARYSKSFRDYRWCLASGDEQCGYPWWSCAENSYGYCSNRYQECRNACRRTDRYRND